MDRGAAEGLRGHTVSFEKNCTNSVEEFARKSVKPPAKTVEDFPANPTCEGHRFVEWNTARNGSGVPFTAQTPIPPNEILVIVYAKWEKLPEEPPPPPLVSPIPLHIEMSHTTLSFSPMVDGNYSELSAVFTVEVSGFQNGADADSVELEVVNLNELSWLLLGQPDSVYTKGSKIFSVHVDYDGSGFAEPSTTIHLKLLNIPEGYEHGNGPPGIRVAVGNGQTKKRPIPVNQANIQAFNRYANTEGGLKLHYKLIENVVLEAPAAQETSNWESIGKYIPNATDPYAEAFTGSFDGDGHTISGLLIHSSENDQGFFSAVGQGALIENLGLIELNVKGSNYSSSHVGALAGINNGTVRSSYAVGNVEGNAYVGGLMGYSYIYSTVEDSYAAVSTKGSNYTGGLAGINYGTVLNSYASGSVKGTNYTGGLLGENIGRAGGQGRVENSYATGSVRGTTRVGGLVGRNYEGTVENSYATGDVEGSGTPVGGLVGHNGHNHDAKRQSTVRNSYATGSVKGYWNVGGLVGQNSGATTLATVQNCVALNPSVVATATGANARRVVGSCDGTATMGNNHAFINMLNSTGDANWSNKGAANNNGADRTAAQLQTADGFPTELCSGPWTCQPGRLPGLFGETVEMPSHITSN
jgi:hypothetical protein